MASLADKASGRAELAEAAIREALATGAGQAALNEAARTLQSEAAKVRRRRPADAALIDAQIAGILLGLAAQLATHQPPRPAGCPRVPRPGDQLAVFAEALAQSPTERDPR